MTKKTRIKLVGDGWGLYPDSYQFFKDKCLIVEMIGDKNSSGVGYFQAGGTSFMYDSNLYAIHEIEILPDEPEQEGNPAKDNTDIDTLTKKIERLEKVINEMNANLKSVRAIVSSLLERV
jgi:hypothetical protein